MELDVARDGELVVPPSFGKMVASNGTGLSSSAYVGRDPARRVASRLSSLCVGAEGGEEVGS